MRIGRVFVAGRFSAVDEQETAVAGLVAVLAVYESETKARGP